MGTTEEGATAWVHHPPTLQTWPPDMDTGTPTCVPAASWDLNAPVAH